MTEEFSNQQAHDGDLNEEPELKRRGGQEKLFVYAGFGGAILLLIALLYFVY